MSNGFVLRLDKSRIPANKLDDPRLAESEEAVCKGMQNETFRKGICLHEAAHAIYMERAGACRVTLHPPLAMYDSQNDRFDIGPAAVQPDFGSVPVETDIMTMARWNVAGGVAQRFLIGGDPALFDDGYERDFSVLFEDSDQYDFSMFSGQAVRHGLLAEEIRDIWEQAKRDVQKDLRSPLFRRQLWERAREFEQQLLEMIPEKDTIGGQHD
jgi:hypothetical protein